MLLLYWTTKEIRNEELLRIIPSETDLRKNQGFYSTFFKTQSLFIQRVQHLLDIGIFLSWFPLGLLRLNFDGIELEPVVAIHDMRTLLFESFKERLKFFF